MATLSPSPLDPFAPPTANLGPRLSPDGGAQRLADRGTRLGAAMLDVLLYTPFFLGGVGIGIALRMASWTPATFKTPTSKFVVVAAVVVACLPLAIYQWYLQSTTGQSLGKRWSKIKVVKKDGSLVDFVSAVLLRTWLPGLVGWALLAVGMQSLSNGYGVIDSLAIFTTQRRCLHDLIAGTKVISLEQG